jgi:hypothetical protein
VAGGRRAKRRSRAAGHPVPDLPRYGKAARIEAAGGLRLAGPNMLVLLVGALALMAGFYPLLHWQARWVLRWLA